MNRLHLMDAALAGIDGDEFGYRAIQLLQKKHHFDVSSFLPFGGAVPVSWFDLPMHVLERMTHEESVRAVHVDGGQTSRLPFIEQYLAYQARYDRELREARVFARSHGQAYVDTLVWKPAERKKLALYNELVAPQGIKSMFVGLVFFRDHATAVLQLARKSGPQFSLAELRALLPALRDIGLMHAALESNKPRTNPLAQAVLSAREGKIAQLVASGLSNREIGQALHLSPNTVRNQLASIFTKTSVVNRSELVAWWFAQAHTAPR